jgi:hypothetical protein
LEDRDETRGNTERLAHGGCFFVLPGVARLMV